MIKITSLHLKAAVMSYFRFKRQWLCASECLNSDVIAITNKDVIEVEIKVNKYDLWKGEAKKSIHNQYKNPEKYKGWHLPNRYYMCVPEYLLEEAKKWVEETNDKYGIILYKHECFNDICMIKKAKTIHKNVNPNYAHAVMMRVCSENIGNMNKQIKEEI